CLTHFALSFFFFLCPAPHRALPSFPTRRSSDLGLSIFAEHMAPDTRFATDLGDIAYFHESHVALMQHWQCALPLPILEVGREARSEEHTSELQSRENLVCRLLLEKKKKT